MYIAKISQQWERDFGALLYAQMMPSKELKNAFLGRRRKEKEGERRKGGRRYSIEDFLPTVNNYDTRCIKMIDKIPQTYQ